MQFIPPTERIHTSRSLYMNEAFFNFLPATKENGCVTSNLLTICNTVCTEVILLSTPKPILILILIVAGILAAAVAVMVVLSHSALQKDYRRTVAETSERCAALEQLNAKFVFMEFAPISRYQIRLNDEAQYDRCQLDELFLDALRRDRASIQQHISLAETNQHYHREYTRRLSSLPRGATPDFAQDQGVPYRVYRQLERQRFNALLLRPTCHYALEFTKLYTDGRGREMRSKPKRYTIADIQRGYQELERRSQQRSPHA